MEFYRLCKRILEQEPPLRWHLPGIDPQDESRLSARKEVALRALEFGLLDLYDEAFGVVGKCLPPQCFYQLGKNLIAHDEERIKPM